MSDNQHRENASAGWTITLTETLVLICLVCGFLAMSGKNWIIGGEFSALVFAPVVSTVVIGDGLLVDRGVGGLLLMLYFAVIVLAWTVLAYALKRGAKVLEELTPKQ